MCVWYKFILEESFESIKDGPKNDDQMTKNLTQFFRITVSFTKENLTEESTLLSNSTRNGKDKTTCYQITKQVSDIIAKLNPFLHPCTIEYSIICVTVFYVIWTNIGRKNFDQQSSNDSLRSPKTLQCRSSSNSNFLRRLQ